jgi:hypothetical protein
MEGLTNIIQIHYSDRDINKLTGTLPDEPGLYTKHFTYNEDFFIKLADEFVVPHFTIHHDVREKTPAKSYLRSLNTLLDQLFSLIPGIFSGLIYFFNPGEILRPGFFKLYRTENKEFLYILRLNLLYNAQYGQIEERGNNDLTPSYRTNSLFLQATILPLDEVIVRQNKIEAFVIEQKISETWIGEQGRGYLLRGIWIDDELSRFFTKLFLPPGKRIYPYFPFLCMYKTICAHVMDPGSGQKEQMVNLLFSASRFLSPHMQSIEKALRKTRFSEDLPLFREIKTHVPFKWDEIFKNITVKAYLNQNDLKEFKIDMDK